MSILGKYRDALELAHNIVDDEDTDVTHDEVDSWTHGDLYDWLDAWDYEWEDGDWILKAQVGS